MKLYPYQQKALEFINKRRYSYISLPPGGGKTLTALEATKDFKHILIICPASLCMLWSDEIEKWYGKKPTQVLKTGKTKIATGYKYVIMSFEKALQMTCYKQLMRWDYEAVIVDEAHALKNPDAKRTEALLGWRTDKARLLTKVNIKKGILLSGTPMMQRPIELYSTLRGLRPELLGDYKRYDKFGVYFAKGYKNPWGAWVFSGQSNVKELAQLSKDFIHRADKEEVYKELPALNQQIVRFDCARNLVEQEKAYDMASLIGSNSSVAFEGLAQIRHEMALEKVPMIIDYVENLLKSGEKVILFAWHRAVINSNCEHFKCALRIDGSVPTNKRSQLARDFNDGKHNLAICQVKAASEGLSFHTATHVVFAETSWNPAENEQAYKRAHRRGQENPVFVHYLVASNSLDDRIMKKVLTKEKTAAIFYDELINNTGEIK
jgi:SWI/SNF-related matrix-associated actin-dependent regulator 1 of chromatin subfamily A